jgi:acylphosphatase
MSDTIRHVSVTGRVQGVGYRAWVAHTADGLGLEGWVRNRRNGSVEVVLAGPVGIVEQMVEHCRRGPSHARVETVVATEAGVEMLELRFAGEMLSILPTL